MRQIAGVVLCFVLAFETTWEGRAGQPATVVREEVVAEVGKKAISLLVPDGERLLLLSREGGKWRLVVDGNAVFADGDAVSPLVESKDGRHLAFAVRRGETTTLIVDGQDRGAIPYHRSGSGFQTEPLPLTLGPDGQVAIHDRVGDARRPRVRVGILGQPVGPEVDAVDLVTIGAGTPPRLAYAAKKEDRWSLVVDGVETPGPSPALTRMAGIEGVPFRALAFSPDGRRFAYWTWTAEPHLGGVAIIDGEPESASGAEAPSLDIVGPIVFSRDSRHAGYLVRESESAWVAVRDGEPRPVPAIDSILAGPVFSPDGEHFVFVARVKDEVVVMIDGRIAHTVADPGEAIQGLTVSAAAEHVAFVATRTGLTGKSQVVLDGVEVPHKGRAFPSSLRFTSSGSIVWLAIHDGKILRMTHP